MRLARWFRGRGITGIWVSEYQRTAQTALPLARRFGIEPVVDARLNEIDIGLLDGLSDDEVRIRFPEAWRASEDRSSDYRWPGGENGVEALERIAGCWWSPTTGSSGSSSAASWGSRSGGGSA
jgi:probable phosphoglycerate mutase